MIFAIYIDKRIKVMNILSSYITQKPITPPSYSAQSSSKNTKTMYAPTSTTKTTLWYVNDIHCQIPKTERLVSAAHQSEITAKQNGADFLKLCSGDTFIGSDEKRNIAAASFFDIAGIHAQAPGNHEFDITASKCAELLKNSNTKILGINMNFPENDNGLSKKVMKSAIHIGENGEKYGLIGVQPSDINERLKKKDILEGITIDDKEQTMNKLQEEVELLQKQGVNKIFLLSHEGNSVEKEIAQNVSGIDVILGGHSHDLIEGVKEGKNLFYSPTGEPVIITQAGRDGNNFGLLNLEFDDQGRITYVQNNIVETNSYAPSMIMSKTINSILGESPVIGDLILKDKIPKNTLLEENPCADFVADALRENLNADVVLINSANFRGSVHTGKVTERDISSIFPFSNKLYKVKLNEKDLVDAVNACGKSLIATNSKPGLLQVSGLRYKLDKEGCLTEMTYIDKSGLKRNIDIDNPDENKVYTAVYDEFLAGGGDNLGMLKREEKDIITKYSYDKDKVTIDYIKSLNHPFEVKKDNRIQII